jgi:hypothetical protein
MKCKRDDFREEPDFGTLSGLRDSDLTKLLGYRVYRHDINKRAKTLKLWIPRKRGNRKLVCYGLGTGDRIIPKPKEP